MTSKITKEFNKAKHALLQDMCMVYSSGGDSKYHLFNIVTGAEIKSSQIHIDILMGEPHRWSCLLAVFSRGNNKKESSAPTIHTFGEKLLKHQIDDYLHKEHENLTDTKWKEHICGVGVLCAPFRIPDNYDAAIVDSIFTKLGAYSGLTDKEVSNQSL